MGWGIEWELWRKAKSKMTCTHTSDWHKNMRPCVACGAEYSDEEAEYISGNAARTFNREQQTMIIKMMEEERGDS